MSEVLKAVTPWIAVIAAVVAAYITFRNQMRLKAFELLLGGRTDLLKAVEDRIEFYRKVLAEVESEEGRGPNFDSLVKSQKRPEKPPWRYRQRG